MQSILSIADVFAARVRTRAETVRTPLVSPEPLRRLAGRKLWLKLESFQRTGAFKFRGALNCVLKMAGGGPGSLRLVTASSGNHALGMSLAGKLVGADITVVMPEGAPRVKQAKAQGYGAKVVLHGEAYDDAQVYARNLAEETGAVYVPSFNHPDIMAGQGVIGLEILEEAPEPATVVAPIGGGGLAAGVAVVMKALVPSARVVGVQAEGAASMLASLREGRPVVLPSLHTVADGIAVRTPGDLTFSVVRNLVDEVVTVPDEEIYRAMRALMLYASVVPEPAAAAGVAAVLAGKVAATEGPTVVVVTGGNVDAPILETALRANLPDPALGREDAH